MTEDVPRTPKEMAWFFYKNMGYRIVEDEDEEQALFDTVSKFLSHFIPQMLSQAQYCPMSDKLVYPNFSDYNLNPHYFWCNCVGAKHVPFDNFVQVDSLIRKIKNRKEFWAKTSVQVQKSIREIKDLTYGPNLEELQDLVVCFDRLITKCRELDAVIETIQSQLFITKGEETDRIYKNRKVKETF